MKLAAKDFRIVDLRHAPKKWDVIYPAFYCPDGCLFVAVNTPMTENPGHSHWPELEKPFEMFVKCVNFSGKED